MKPPVLCLQTVYFHESDRDDAQRLGLDLYERLTRPIDDPLAYGPGIPVLAGVHWERVNFKSAETLVLIPVLGNECYLTTSTTVLQTLNQWTATLTRGGVLPVPTSGNWRSREDELRGKLMLTMLYGKGDPRKGTLDEIVLSTNRIWEAGKNVQLFISHAKADLTSTESAAEKIYNYVVTDTTGSAFFDARKLRSGESLVGQLDEAVSRGVFIAVRGDAYSSRIWCQRELLQAKLHGMPTLSVEVLRRGEMRSSPYGGNSPSLVWERNPAPIVSQAMVEWLRAEFFRREAQRIIESADLPRELAVVTRPPELLDLAQGPLQSERAQLVLHPDPELSALERRVLKSARPRLHLTTPSTAFRRLLSRRDEVADASSPLEGMQVAMSLSDTPDAGGPDGFTKHHAEDATIHIARTLVSAGAAIAYGGDFRPGGFTPLLAELIQTYNQTASKRAQDLHSYLSASILISQAPKDISLQIHHLRKPADFAKEALLPDPSDVKVPLPDALYFSDMRRVMEQHVAARVILGGNARPRLVQGGPGYGGRYPGLVEEAWRALEARKPLYVAGGFGGASALVAALLEGKSVPVELMDENWKSSELFLQQATALDGHSGSKLLGLPESMEKLAKAITDLAVPLLHDDAASVAWNGLSREDNCLLFRTRDPVTLAALVSRGLLQVARQQALNKLEIELVNDSLTAADRLDAIAIATLEGIPLGGAGAAVDHLTGGLATMARSRGKTLVSLQESLVDADWLFLASLGALGEPPAVLESVEKAAAETGETAARHGFQRVGVVTFGGNVLADTEKIAGAMVRGFFQGQGRAVLVWYETDEKRFDTLAKVLGENPKVKLTTRRSLTRIVPSIAAPEPLHLTVTLENGILNATCLPPSSAATVSTTRTPLSEDDLAKLSAGAGEGNRSIPTPEILQERGQELATRLFGPFANSILSTCRDARLVIVHDTPSSKVPFEILLASPDLRPALQGGITRRLSIPGLSFERQFSHPPKKGKLRVLLVANPTGDLAGANAEATAVRNILEQQQDRLELEQLWADQATVENVTTALARADVLHYCGHAFFDGPRAGQSGLILAGPSHRGTRFTADALCGTESLPRMAFVNACEAGRVRGEIASEAAAFAELFLRSGMDAYLGTYWQVGDRAAAFFACTVYVQLALGNTLEQATLMARQELFEKGEPDWANYMLFGGGAFRLATQD